MSKRAPERVSVEMTGSHGMRGGRHRALTFALLLFSLLFSIAAMEVLLRVARPLEDPYWRYKTRPDLVQTYIPSQFPPDLSLVLRTEPGLPGMDREVTFSVNNMGLRGDELVTPKPVDEFRVFVIGGSTTECLYISNEKAFTRVIQDSLAALLPSSTIRVYGAGKSGDKTYDHIAMFAHRLAHLQPDLVVVFPGINDLLASAHGRDYLFMSRADNAAWRMPQLLRLAATELQVGRLVFGALKPTSYREAVEELAMTSTIRRSVRIREQLPLAAGPPPVQLDPYRDNLRSIAGLAEAHGAPVVFLTQATTWASTIDPRAKEWHWMSIGPDVRFDEARMEAAMNAYNAVTRSMAGTGAHVLDLAALMPKSLEFFYDDVHFNNRGAAMAGGVVARFLAERGLVRTP
jgi:lysophospholipase L1-like esterase